MPDESPSTRALQRRKALSRWENEGGAVCQPRTSTSEEALSNPAEPSGAELTQLRARVVALENLVIALLAHSPAEELDDVRAMAACLAEKGASTLPDDSRTSDEMLRLLERSTHLRNHQEASS